MGVPLLAEECVDEAEEPQEPPEGLQDIVGERTFRRWRNRKRIDAEYRDGIRYLEFLRKKQIDTTSFSLKVSVRDLHYIGQSIILKSLRVALPSSACKAY